MFKRAAISSSSTCTVSISLAPGLPMVKYVELDGKTFMHIIDICCSSIKLDGPDDAVMVLQG
jgi:hypothetical protein